MSAKKQNDSIDIDLSKLKNIFSIQNANIKYAIITLLILVAVFFAYSVRSDPADLEVTDQWAASSINNQILNEARARVQQQYPSLTGTELDQRANDLAVVLRDQMGDQYTQQVQAQGEYFRQRLQLELPNGDQQTYLLAIDPWQYYRLTNNYLENGYPGDELKDGKSWNNHMLAPNGRAESMNFHIWFSALWHKIYSIFKPNAELLQSFFWVPVIISMLSVIPAFFIVYRRTNYLGGFVSAMLVAIHPYFVTRTAAGFADTDAYNVFFPLMIAWLVLEAFEAKSLNKSLLLTGIAGLTVGIFSFAWVGWWYLFDFVLISCLAVIWFKLVQNKLDSVKWAWYYKLAYFLAPILLLFLAFLSNAVWLMFIFGILVLVWIGDLLWSIKTDYLKKKEFFNSINKYAIATVMFVISSAVFVTLLKGVNAFKGALLSPFEFSTIQNAAQANFWPNVYTTVAELNQANISQIITNIGFNINGGALFFFIAILGIALSFTKTKLELKDWIIMGTAAVIASILLKNTQLDVLLFVLVLAIPAILGMYLSLGRNVDIIYALLLTVWFMGTMYASTLGIRFILLMVPVFAVAVGIAFGQLSKILEHFSVKEFKLSKSGQKMTALVFFIIFSLMLINPVKAGQNVGMSEVPSFDDAWWDTLTQIKAESQPDAIINSWWDFGHWFKAVADRAVTFDGASQNTPQAHWIGRALSAPTEAETIDILRMLDCGGNNAQTTLVKEGVGDLDSIILTKKLISMSREDAATELESLGIDAETILQYTHCEAPENYFITSGDMVGKSGVWSHFGNWDFNKAFIYNTVKKNPIQAEAIAKEKLSLPDSEIETLVFQARGFTDDQANNWIGPFDGYVGGGSWFPCEVREEVLACTVGLGLSRDASGNSNVIERVNFNTNNPGASNLTAAVYSSANQRLGGAEITPQRIVYTGENDLEVVDFEDSDIQNIDFLVDTVNNRVMITGSSVTESTFTKLFFLNGMYMDSFEKVSDRTSVTGNRIVVWKVKW